MKKDLQGPLIGDRYKRLELIGEGAEAYVYKVEDTKEPEGSSNKL